MHLELVNNCPKYFEFMRRLRNDNRVQPGFIEQVSITPEQQERYMEKFANNYMVCLADGAPAGYIGEIEGDIRLATHPDFQRLGVGRFMISKFIKVHPNIYAVVKVDNEASLKLFRSLGFQETFLVFHPPNAIEKNTPNGEDSVQT